MYKIKQLLPIQVRLQMFHSFVQSHLNFCSLVWGFAAKSHIESLFSKQKQGVRMVMPGFVNYKYRDGQLPAHTKSSFNNYDILTVHRVILKNALTLMHKVKHFPKTLPQSILDLFVNNRPDYGSSYEDAGDWLAVYNKTYFRASIFYKGPILTTTEQSQQITTLPSLFNVKIFMKAAKRMLLQLQSAGPNDEWPNFLLYNMAGLRKSIRTQNTQ